MTRSRRKKPVKLPAEASSTVLRPKLVLGALAIYNLLFLFLGSAVAGFARSSTEEHGSGLFPGWLLSLAVIYAVVMVLAGSAAAYLTYRYEARVQERRLVLAAALWAILTVVFALSAGLMNASAG